ncbi:hypothetical protein O181_096067 [Austropuccinia psidii MF-1]|uniref:Uncharacterized protein n=1 Tax=Austropuccinia psidii MF-1 TaxID=1389203 RepID=A0A9Q3J6K0_9BASI|nr:hypothetical protein [Austropuccinia psidii MF-1]
MLVMLANKHTRNVCLLFPPSDHPERGVLAQDALARTLLWSTMMKPYPSANGHWDPKQADGNNSGQLALDYTANEGWRLREDIQAWADCHHVLSLMGFKRQKQNPSNTPQQDSPVPSFPCEQTPPQPTPGSSGTQWSEELFREPSRTKEPPIPGPSPSSQPPEDITTREPEPEVAPTQSMEEPFGKSPLLFLHSYQLLLTFSLTISSSSCHSPLDTPVGAPPSHPVSPLIPMMTLARNLPTYNLL